MPKISSSRPPASRNDFLAAETALQELNDYRQRIHSTRRVRADRVQHGDDGDILDRHPFPESEQGFEDPKPALHRPNKKKVIS